MGITPDQARAELARREITRRQQLAASKNEENLLQKVMRYGIKDPAIGLLSMAKEFGNIPHKIFPFLPAQPDIDWSKELGVENPDAGDKAIQFIGQYAPSFAIPGANLGHAGKLLGSIPKVGRFASRAVSEAIPQALYSAAQSPHESLKSGAETAAVMTPFSLMNELMQGTNPVVRNVAKTLAGAGAGYLGREGAKTLGFGETGADAVGLASAALGARGFSTKKDLMRKLTEGVSADIANPRIAAANRLKLDYLTPAEAGVSPWAAKQQGSLGRTEEGGKLLYDKSIARRESEKRAIDKTLDMIYSPKLDSVIDEAYKGLKPVNLPTEFPLQYKDNAIIEAAEKRVKKSPAYQESLKKYFPENVKMKEGQTDVEPTSLVYWDHVKRALYDMAEVAKRKGSGGESSIIDATRKDLVKQMDSYYPEYAEARSLYERKSVRKGLEKSFDQKEVNGTNFYRALASQKKFDEILSHLKNAPEAAENLTDMRMIFKDIMGPPTIKTAKGKEEHGMNQDRNDGNFMESLFKNVFTKGGNDKAAIEFITSKDWGKQLKEINKISDKQMKMVALSMALSKGISQFAGKED